MPRLDDTVSLLLDGLRVCLTEQLAASRNGDVCASLIAPGTLAVADYCTCGSAVRGGGEGCGMAWTRLDRVFPYRTFPQLDQTGGPCGGPKAATIELGVLRCKPMGTGRTAPTPVDQINATLGQLSDMGAMQRAIDCCDVLTERSVVLGTYTPRDSGDCFGGVWLATVSTNPTP